MPTYNYKSRELIAKIVYYGPGRCGKTTNLQQIHARMRPETRSELLSVATETDRTIYFDLLPLNLGTISGMKFMVRLFTVPGQVYYGETRKLVLRGADGIVFVADSQDHMLDENRQSLKDLKDNLAANGIDYGSIPIIMQWNKRDLPRLVPEAELEAALNERSVKALSAVASEGTGVLETLRAVTLSVFNQIKAGGKAERQQGAVPSAMATAGVAMASPASAMPQQNMVPANVMQGQPMPTNVVQGQPNTMSPNFAGTNGALQRAVNVAAQSAGPIQQQQRSMAASGPAVNDLSPPRATPPAPPGANGNRRASIPPPPPPASQLPRPAAAAMPPPAPLNPNGPQPMRIGTEMVLDEFKNLAIMHSQMAERLSSVEAELGRLGRENQEIREFLARQNQP